MSTYSVDEAIAEAKRLNDLATAAQARRDLRNVKLTACTMWVTTTREFRFNVSTDLRDIHGDPWVRADRARITDSVHANGYTDTTVSVYAVDLTRKGEPDKRARPGWRSVNGPMGEAIINMCRYGIVESDES
jgi:hypothetical protein